MMKRIVPLIGAVVGLSPVVYLALVWTGLIEERYVRFERPLMALPAALVLLFIAFRLSALRLDGHRLRRLLVELFSTLAALCFAFAAIGVEIGLPFDRLTVLIGIDRSRSIDLVANAASRLERELQVAELGMRPDDRIGVVAFAAEAALEDPPRPRSQLPAPGRVEIGRDATDLAAAIRRALSEVPADTAARIVLLTDGVSTRGDPLQAAAAALTVGVPIDTIPLDQESLQNLRVVNVTTASHASEDEVFELRVATHSSSEAQVEVRVLLDGVLIRRGTARVAKGEDVLFLRETAPGPGLHRYDVELSARDAQHDLAHEDNSGAAFVRVRGASTALILEGDPARAAPLESALGAAGYLTTSAGPSGVPADVAGFALHDLVVLSDIEASQLSPAQMAALSSYVQDLGGGLVLMGGDASMGPGGYGKTPIEAVSPVSFDLKQERRRASLAEVIAVDYSGSMAMRTGTRTKLELANEAAARSAELLGAGDRLGVMHVDTTVSWTVPLSPLDDKPALIKKIRAVTPGGGGIYVDLTLEAAYEALARENVNLKHLLLFSDGSDAEERPRALSLVSEARSRGITTSVVALGQGPDVPDLETMSRLGGGRFYLIEDASRLPAVFAQETILAARSSIHEVSFFPSAAAPGAPTRGIDFQKAPALTGYVVTLAKGRAQVLLQGPELDPILATWSVGLGRAGAFTSDYKDRWGGAWTEWPEAARLFAQLARDLARRSDDQHVRLQANTNGGELELKASVVDSSTSLSSLRRFKANVVGPDGFNEEVALEASGPGLFQARLPLDRPGAYVATAIDEVDGRSVATTGAVLKLGEELRPTGTDRGLLRRISKLSGGRLRDTLAGVFHDRQALRFNYKSIDGLLLQSGAWFLLLAVACRRLGVPDFLSAFMRRRIRKGAEARQASHPSPRLAALARAKARGRAREHALEAPPAAGAPTETVSLVEPAPGRPKTPPPVTPPPPDARRGGSAAEVLLAKRRGRAQRGS